MLSRLSMLIARRPLITSRAFLQHGSRCYGVLHAAPSRLAHPRPGPVTSSLMSIAGAAIVTWTFYKVIWDDALATRVLQQQVSCNFFMIRRWEELLSLRPLQRASGAIAVALTSADQ
ncbi:hypothetical protein F5878DRAFT_578377 [Lentinula raphanica]|uniref:Uncharacterized protein n=1 Tax=Lentinula raphanica TaxID=153919 RepID=A0AA38UHC9_9AGAR|nr:hypothetical protein F5878DRAFT_578377 [Lentinula raphanica]